MPADGRSSAGSRIAAGFGLAATLLLFSGYRPWGDTPLNGLLLLGPVLLAGGLASLGARRAGEAPAPGDRPRTPARNVAILGGLMLLAGGFPWLYTPLTTGGELNQASGMLGTIIFLFVGLPGLAVTAVGVSRLRRERRGADR